MNQDFAFVEHNGLALLVYVPWWRSGQLHGMTVRPLSFGGDDVRAAARMLCGAIGVNRLALPRQVHGNEVLDLRDQVITDEIERAYGDLLKRRECDAIICPASQVESGARTAYGVLSADCVPIIVRGRSAFALIHAGWRGLANGVIARAVSCIDEPEEAIVFGAAGGDLYEVGREVIDAIGDSAVYKPRPGAAHTLLLDTAETAINQLHRSGAFRRVVSAGVCTIADERFHSHRRDREEAGRAVTFICP